MGKREMRVVLVNNIVAPYVEVVLTALARKHKVSLVVLSCALTEPGRHWRRSYSDAYKQTIMSGIRIHIKGNRNTYLNPLVVLELWRERPDVVIIAGYAPTMLLAALYAFCTGTPLILSHDAWTQVDLASQSLVYRALRRWIIRRVGAALVASKKGAEFTRAFGLPLERIYVA